MHDELSHKSIPYSTIMKHCNFSLLSRYLILCMKIKQGLLYINKMQKHSEFVVYRILGIENKH